MVYPQQPPPGEFPGEYPPEYYNGGYGPRPWMPRVHTGFRYFLLLLVILLIVGYFTGNNPLQPVTNVINPAQPTGVSTSNPTNPNDFNNNPATPNNAVSGTNTHAPMTVTTTVAPNSQTPNAYSGVPVPVQSAVDPQTEMSIRESQAAADATFDARAHKLKAIRASNSPTVPDGWYTWSVEKRARYVRALMDRIDAP